MIKEKWLNPKNGKTLCAIRTRTYQKSYNYIEGLVDEALDDFPDLKTGDIYIVVYAGNRQKGQMGVQFWRDDVHHPSYTNVATMAPAFNQGKQ